MISRPCKRMHPDPRQKARIGAYRDGDCRACWRALNDLAAEWGDPGQPDRRLSTCRHFGNAVGTVGCKQCKKATALKTFACGLFGKCTLATPIDGHACCAICFDGDCAHDPTEPVSEQMCKYCLAKVLEGPPMGWSDGWERWEVTHQAHRIAMERFIRAEHVAPSSEGRGVVMGAGGHSRFVQAWVSLTLLRAVGSELPVEVWHLGPGEIDPWMRSALEGRFAPCRTVDALAEPDQPRILNGWELKPFSVLRSRFREVLYLDSDCVPVRDPGPLFDSAPYRDTGAVFWPDIAPYDRKEWLPDVCWRNVGLEPRDEPDFESGQFLVDKSRCYDALRLCAWMNGHSDWFYRWVYGDKSTFHLAWRKIGLDYGMPMPAPPSWNKVCFQHVDFEGHTMFQHRCQDKWRLDGGNRRVRGFLREDECFRALEELRRVWHGRPWDWSDQTAEETEAAEAVVGRRFLYRRVGHDERPIVLDANGRVGEGAAGLEQRWTLRLLDGVPSLVISGPERATMFLRQQ